MRKPHSPDHSHVLPAEILTVLVTLLTVLVTLLTVLVMCLTTQNFSKHVFATLQCLKAGNFL